MTTMNASAEEKISSTGESSIALSEQLATLIHLQNDQLKILQKIQNQNEVLIDQFNKFQDALIGEEDYVYVKVEDIDMPFGSLVGFIVKTAIASVPAYIVIGAIGLILFLLLSLLGITIFR